jgi:prephenate dehydratase
MTKVAFQGIAGAYSEEAIRQFFGPEVESIPCRTLDNVFPAVESGDADYGMVPVENAVAGSVARSYELLMERDLRIYAETILHVRHTLLAVPGTTLDDLKRVRSHPQALAQCQRYLSRHGLEPEPAFDTAGSARDLAANPEPDVAAIASALAAELYGLEILGSGIEDFPFNYTRFFVLALDDPPRAQRSKTSLVFSSRHQPGALYECLGEFAMRGINLTKIESRPRLNRPWQYIFYLDFEGHWQDPECEAAVMGLLRRSSFVKLLGSYPAATTPVLDDAVMVSS